MKFTEFTDDIGLSLTPAQRVLCKVSFDGTDPCALEGAERELARVLFGEVDTVPALARRTIVLTLGRGSGKTTIAAAYGLYRMVTADLSRCGPGDIPHMIAVAPTTRTAKLVVGMAQELTQWSKALRRRVESETKEGFILRRPDGKRVAFSAFAASRGGASARGLSVLSFVLDESEFFQSDAEFVVTDRDVYGAIVPRLMAAGAGVLISTPWPVPTMTAELREKNFGAPSTALCAVGPTLVMRPGDETIESLVAAERERDPDNAAREFDCDASATSGSSTLFTAEMIRACVDMNLAQPSPRVGSYHPSFGCDVAFVRDSSTLVGSVDKEGVVEVQTILEKRPEKGQPLRPKEVVDDFAKVITDYGAVSVWGDIHYKESVREHLEPYQIEFCDVPAGANGKQETYLHARKMLSEGRVRLPNNPRFLAQLRSIVSKPMSGGGLQISAPRRAGLAHGDIVSAFVASLWAVKQGEQPDWLRAMVALDQRNGVLFDGGNSKMCNERYVNALAAIIGWRKRHGNLRKDTHTLDVGNDGTYTLVHANYLNGVARWRSKDRFGNVVFDPHCEPGFKHQMAWIWTELYSNRGGEAP